MDKRGFIMGLGVGMVVVSIAFLISYISLLSDISSQNSSMLSDEEIINRAKQLGLVENNYLDSSLFEQHEEKKQEEEDNGNLEENQELEEPHAPEEDNIISDVDPGDTVSGSNNPPPAQSQGTPIQTINTPPAQDNQQMPLDDVEGTIQIEIVDGMSSISVSHLLYLNGLVEDADEFQDYMNEHNVTKVLQTGIFDLETGSTYEEILDTITKPLD